MFVSVFVMTGKIHRANDGKHGKQQQFKRRIQENNVLTRLLCLARRRLLRVLEGEKNQFW
jgi:hypothetical protein